MAEDIIAINSGVYTSLGTAIVYSSPNTFVDLSGEYNGVPITQINTKYDIRFDDPDYYN